jgi:hypothetical protein
MTLEEDKAIDSATESAKRLEETAKKQEAISDQIGTNLHYTCGEAIHSDFLRLKAK